MTTEKTHTWVTLRDRAGKDFLRVRIPRVIPPLAVLQWGARFYVHQGRTGDYHEADCFFLTLVSQYPQTKEEILNAHTEPNAW